MNPVGRIGFLLKGDYSDTETYDFMDIVYYNGASYVAKKPTIGNAPVRKNEYWQIFAEGGALTETSDISETKVTFEQGSERTNIASGEKLSVLFGKIKKVIADLSNTAFDGFATKWRTARNINGMSVDGSANRANYGTCSTAAATATKVVACAGYALVTGAEIAVKFTVTNTAANPTLNVNSTGAKSIYYRGAAISAGYLAANRTYAFRYNGTQYELVGDVDTNTTYGSMSGATASAAGKAGMVPAPPAGAQGKYLRGDGAWVAPATTLAGTVPGIPLDQTMGKQLKDELEAINSNLQAMTNAEVITLTANTAWIKSNDTLCFKIAGRYFFQFIEVEFSKASTNTDFKSTLLWTLSKSVGYEKVFLLYPMDGGQPLRMLCSGNKIYGHYSGLFTNMHYFGLLVM